MNSSKRLIKPRSMVISRQVSMVQYQRLTGKSDDELQRIFEKEMRLGVLSSQNILYPFPGMQRPAREAINMTDKPDSETDEIFLHDVPNHFPDGPDEKQLEAFQSLKTRSDHMDDHFKTWENRTQILNEDSFLEEFLIMKMVRELNATVALSDCPKLLEEDAKIPIAAFAQPKRNKVIIVSCPAGEDRQGRLEMLTILLTNIRDFLAVRGFSASLLNQTKVMEDFDNTDNLRLSTKSGCVLVRRTESSDLSGGILTDARSSDELVLKLLIKNKRQPKKADFVTIMERFCRVGLERRFLNKRGNILDQEVYDWYYATLFEDFLQEKDIDRKVFRTQVDNLVSCFV